MNTSDQLTQVLQQLAVLSDVVRELQAREGTDPSPAHEEQVRSTCEAKTKAGKPCPVAPVTGTSLCIGHTRQAQARSKNTTRKSTRKSVAKATSEVKANRAGKYVAIQALDDALRAGTHTVYVRSNVGARKINQALRLRGYTVGAMVKRDGVRVWTVSGHGHTYEHRMGKYAQGQTTHHRSLVKVS